MLTKFFVSLLLVTFCFVAGCKKTNDVGSDPPSFTWTFKGKNYSTPDNTAYLNSLGSFVIAAGTGTTAISFQRKVLFDLTSFNVGTYSIDNNNHLYYVDDDSNDQFATAGQINITGNDHGQLSGNFSCTLVGPSNTPNVIAGSFTNVVIKP